MLHFVKLLRSLVPVSYTHLDVYKRQILLSSLVPLLNTGKSSAVNYNEFVSILDKQKVTEMTVMPGIYVTSVEGKYTKNEKGKDVTCLLYTSRCV